MKKAISLAIQLWIEADDEPAHDFAETTIQSVRDILESGAGKYPALSISIRSIKEKT